MKKILALLLSVLLIGMSLCAYAEDASTPDDAQTEDAAATEAVAASGGVQSGTELTVGSTTRLGGNFGTDIWGINTADLDVRALLHGYSTVAYMRTMGLTFDTQSMAGITSVEEADGSSTYTFELAGDLTYNDGTPLTAQDYVFSVLLSGTPLLKELGAAPLGMSHIAGYDAYAEGRSDSISGVRLLSDTSFSINISAEYVTFFYGLAMLNVQPYPIHVIAPGCVVKDDGSGIYIAAADNAGSLSGSGYTPGQFSKEMLEVTLTDPVNGYEYNPKVTSGPYSLESFDMNTGVATFVINTRYKGNYEGQKPSIEKLVYKNVENETMIAELKGGDVGLLNKVSNGTPVEEGRSMVTDGEGFQMANYLRTGFAYLAFACEDGPTSSAAVRRAVAMCLDKDAIAGHTAAGSSRRVYGYYGLGQWMATYSMEDSDTGQSTNVQESLTQLDVPMDLEAAKALLVEDGWTLNAEGGEYAEGSGGVRYRQGANGLEALTIKWAKTEGSEVADLIEQGLKDNLAAAGIALEITEMPFIEMVAYYYRESPREYNMYFMASNFNYVFDPYYDFNTSDVYQGTVNRTGIKDEELMNRARTMRETPSSDPDTYVLRWLDFQERFVEVMPMVPLYSNVYFDFYTDSLQGYEIANHSGWALAILYATMSN